MSLRPSGVPKAVWEISAHLHSEFSRSMDWLIRRSLDVLERGPDSDTDLGAEERMSSQLRSLAIARGREEARLESEGARDELGKYELEYFCLLGTLSAWASREKEIAQTSREMASNVKRGRPTRQKLSHMNALAQLAYPEGSFRWVDARSLNPGKKGRPRDVSVSDEAIAEAVRQGMEAGATSQNEALRRFAAHLLQDQGKHTAGHRVTELAAKLKRRLYRAGARGPKAD